MDRVFIAGLLVLLIVVGLIALYVGNTPPPTVTYTTPPAMQPTPTTPAP
jgi:hypothetical protein